MSRASFFVFDFRLIALRLHLLFPDHRWLQSGMPLDRTGVSTEYSIAFLVGNYSWMIVGSFDNCLFLPLNTESNVILHFSAFWFDDFWKI